MLIAAFVSSMARRASSARSSCAGDLGEVELDVGMGLVDLGVHAPDRLHALAVAGFEEIHHRAEHALDDLRHVQHLARGAGEREMRRGDERWVERADPRPERPLGRGPLRHEAAARSGGRRPTKGRQRIASPALKARCRLTSSSARAGAEQVKRRLIGVPERQHDERADAAEQQVRHRHAARRRLRPARQRDGDDPGTEIGAEHQRDAELDRQQALRRQRRDQQHRGDARMHGPGEQRADQEGRDDVVAEIRDDDGQELALAQRRRRDRRSSAARRAPARRRPGCARPGARRAARP